MADLQSENEKLRADNRELRRQLNIQRLSLEAKNRALDAMHWVWCDGGCSDGVHRWDKTPLTEEIVKEVENHARRLRRWLENSIERNQRPLG